jgi:hypothetical protein
MSLLPLEEGKQFFFEKKNQKTFGLSGERCLHRPL